MRLPFGLSQWFERLQPREQRVLRMGLPIIGIILFVGSLGGLLDARDAALQRWERAVALEPRLSSLPINGGPTNGGPSTLTFVDAPFEQVLDQIAEWEMAGGRIQSLQLRRTTDGRVSGELRGSVGQP